MGTRSVFISGDTLHAKLASSVVGEGRRFVPLRYFKAEMARHVAEHAATEEPPPLPNMPGQMQTTVSLKKVFCGLGDRSKPAIGDRFKTGQR